MAYLCENLVNGTCTAWVVFEEKTGFMPVITAQDRDHLLLWFIGIFLVVFTLKMLRKLLGI